MKIEMAKVENLIPYENNTRTHSKEQINQIASSIEEFGFTNPILIDEEGGVIAGHGRIAGAKLLNIDEVPTVTLTGLTEAQKKAYIIADNKLALNAGWDEDLLKTELRNLEQLNFNLDLLGFEGVELDELLEEQDYKIDAKKEEKPKYEITPELMEGYNYVVLFFDNDIDWLSAEQKLGLPKVSAKFEQQTGIGRVIEGKGVIERL